MRAAASRASRCARMVRGRTVYLDGKVIGEKGWGRQAQATPPG